MGETLNIASLLDRPVDKGPETPVHIAQVGWEFEQALELYRLRAPRNVLEIGSWEGGTLYHWIKWGYPDSQIVSIDLHERCDNRAAWYSWASEAVDIDLVTIKGDSHNSQVIAQAAEYGPYSWVFIDAGHYYTDVALDWKIYKHLVMPGGVVLFHDILPEPGADFAQVHVLWKEIQRQGYVTQEIVANEAETREFGIGVVYL